MAYSRIRAKLLTADISQLFQVVVDLLEEVQTLIRTVEGDHSEGITHKLLCAHQYISAIDKDFMPDLALQLFKKNCCLF